MELAKALRQVRAIATPEQYTDIRSILVGSLGAEIGQAEDGLSEEDEFALLCILMGTCTDLAPLEQKHSIAIGSAAPDFLARFKPGLWIRSLGPDRHTGYRCFVEVKSTSKDKVTISGAHLAKLRAFADGFGHPLVFAVRFLRFAEPALWVMVDDSQRTRRSITIDVSAFTSGLRPILWDEHAYMLVPGTTFVMTFSPEASGNGMRNVAYGELVELRIVTSGVTYTRAGGEATIAAAFFEAYGLEETSILTVDGRVHVTYSARNMALSIADLLYGFNRLARDEEGRIVYDAGRVLRQLADGLAPGFATRQFIESFAGNFCDMRVLTACGYGNPVDNFARWLETGGTADSG
jgi:hypothetical protein